MTPALHVPDVADLDTLSAAMAYAEAGWYVGPVKHRTKNPGSVLGDDWHRRTSREPEVLVSWYAGTDYGVFLHCGRSGALVFDVDTPERLHPLIAQAVTESAPPWQSTRPDQPTRRHYVFAQPSGRMLGNSLGQLAGGWGEVRGRNGVIVVAPSEHEDATGRYAWGQTGTVPNPPGYLLERLPEAIDAADAATDAEVRSFLAAHSTGTERPELLEIHLRAWSAKVEAGESRHDSTPGHLAGAMKEARLGCYSAATAAGTFESAFLAAVTAPGHGKQGKARTLPAARSEWRGLLSWAVAQAEAADLAQVTTRLAEKVPSLAPAQIQTSLTTGRTSLPDADDDDTVPVFGVSWLPVDLTETIAGLLGGTITRHAPSVGVRDDGTALFYPGKVNGVAGASGSGKSWTAMYAAKQELDAAETVVYIDLEDDATGVVARMLDLGADPEAVADRFKYVSPDESYGLAARAALEALVVDLAPSLVVIDSTGESMALDGAKPNDDDDTARWFRKLPGALARLGPAVIALDHVVKADDGGMWPIGSQRKRAAVNGAQYMQTTVRPFAKDAAGAAKLICAKDRHGNYRPGQKVADLTVTPLDGGVRIEMKAPTVAGLGEPFRPTNLMEKVSRVIEVATEPLTFRGIDELVRGKQAHIAAATDVLAAEGYVTVEDGPRRSKLHTSVRPYRQAEDPKSDVYEPGDTQAGSSTSEPSVSVSLLGKGDGRQTLTPSPGDSGETVGDGQTLDLDSPPEVADHLAVPAASNGLRALLDGGPAPPIEPAPPVLCRGCGTELDPARAFTHDRCVPCWDDLLARQPRPAEVSTS